jgi:chemotaxis protein methyltransferase CheR
VARIVTDETGNRVEEKNLSTIETRLKSRMIKLGLKDFGDYDKYLTANDLEERKVLRGLMTTHHTFFFREFQHFDVLQEWINTHVKSGRWTKSKPVKVWCAAASRGQEPYSLAMFLQVHLKQAHGIDFQIHATDIDSESIGYGQNGVYPYKEVQSIPMAYLSDNWARGTGDISNFVKAKKSIRDPIHWGVVNLLENKAYGGQHGPFDVVFCRNVFIYFEEKKIHQITRDIMSNMVEGGLFISGLSEPLAADTLGLAKVGPSSYQTSFKKGHAPAVAAPAAVASAAPPPLRALVVDDSPTIQKLLKKLLLDDKTFTHVDVANHGEEAARMLAAGRYDLITLDIHMPVMGGIEFLERAYKKDSHPPVLVVSSVSREDRTLATRALELGAKDYVEKPDLARMKESAEEILSKARTVARMKNSARASLDLDRSFGRDVNITNPASKMRVVEVDFTPGAQELVNVARSFDLESQSPPTLWVVERDGDLVRLEELLKSATHRRVHRLGRAPFEANAHYVCRPADFAGLVRERRVPTHASLSALLSRCHFELIGELEKLQPAYVLVNESQNISSFARFPWVEQAPATSYASLSAEVFVGIRKNRKDRAA